MDDGWKDITLSRPQTYDLVELTDGERVYRGWRSGTTWDGLHIPHGFRPTRYRALNAYLEPMSGQFARFSD